MDVTINTTRIRLVTGDITNQPDISVIVNAANNQLRGGSGVCGAIFKAAGWAQMQAACDEHPPIGHSNWRCVTGNAKHTPAFDLPNQGVIHTVGPIYNPNSLYPGQNAKELARAYWSALLLADEKSYSSIAFPAVSCGIYGYPLPEASTVAVQTVVSYFRTQRSTIREVRFVFIPFADGPEIQREFTRAMGYLNGVELPAYSDHDGDDEYGGGVA